MVEQFANRRRTPRFEAVFTVVSVWLETESDERHAAQVIDLSTSGVRLSTGHALHRGDERRFILEAPSLDIRESCRLVVRWVTPGKRNATLAGCELIEHLSDDTLSRLAAAGQLNRRRDERFPISVQGLLSQELSPQEGVAVRVENLSQGGLRLYTPETVQLGQRLLLLLRSDGQRIVRVLVNPVWQMKVQAGYFVGCSFLQSTGYRSVVDVVGIGTDPRAMTGPPETARQGPKRRAKPVLPLIPEKVLRRPQGPSPGRRKEIFIGIAGTLVLLICLIVMKLRDTPGGRQTATRDRDVNATTPDISQTAPEPAVAASPVLVSASPSDEPSRDSPSTQTEPAVSPVAAPSVTGPSAGSTAHGSTAHGSTAHGSDSGPGASAGADAAFELDPEQLAEFRGALRSALRLAAGRNEAQAAEQLTKADVLSGPLGRAECVDGARRLAQRVHEFWIEFDTMLGGLESGATFTYRERTITILEIREEAILIRYDGKSREYNRSKLPAKLVTALADRWLDKTQAENRIRHAAFLLATYPENGHTAEQLGTLWARLRADDTTLPELASILEPQDPGS